MILESAILGQKSITKIAKNITHQKQRQKQKIWIFLFAKFKGELYLPRTEGILYISLLLFKTQACKVHVSYMIQWALEG